MEENQWTDPFYASFNLESMNYAPFVTPDGERLYFISTEENFFIHFHKDVYYVTRSGSDWSDPQRISDNVNDFSLNSEFSVAENYNLYFQDNDSHDLYYSKFSDGDYQEPEKLPEAINSSHLEEGSPFIAPGENYIIFSRKEGGFTNLYVSFKDQDNNWTEGVAFGSAINTDADECYGYVSADEKFLFFLRKNQEGSFPYWVDASVIENLR